MRGKNPFIFAKKPWRKYVVVICWKINVTQRIQLIWCDLTWREKRDTQRHLVSVCGNYKIPQVSLDWRSLKKQKTKQTETHTHKLLYFKDLLRYVPLKKKLKINIFIWDTVKHQTSGSNKSPVWTNNNKKRKKKIPATPNDTWQQISQRRMQNKIQHTCIESAEFKAFLFVFNP